MLKPTKLDHFFAHPTISVVALQWLTWGAVSILEGCVPSFDTPSSVAVFPSVPVVISGIAYIIAGALTLWTIYTSHHRIDLVWMIKKLGYTIAIIGAGIYTFYGFQRVSLGLLAVSFGFGHILIGIAGIIAVTKNELVVRDMMKEQGHEA
jgi:hypothetical protein